MNENGRDANMEVERIATLEAFEAERERWEALERRDPHAMVFTTWRWLRSYFPHARLRWSVLAARDGGETVAYLPIARNASPIVRELALGGNPTADYTGMIADPARAEAAIGAFADAIVREPWDAFNVGDVNDPRIDTLVRRLEDRGMRVISTEGTECFSCALPDTWERYITESISAKTRVNMLRVERRLAEAVPAFRISEPSAADVDAHIEAMLLVNHSRQGGNLRKQRARYGPLFRDAFDRGLLRMTMYWDGEKPLAGGTAFVDADRSYFGLYMIGFDQAYEKLSPGKGIIGRAIRIAIESGYQRFDFMRGAEPFKARYASEVTVTRHYRVLRPGLRAAVIERARPKWLDLKLAVANVVYGPGRQL
ncbi:MAG TPA: GNAT family N-acetyltransferase [Candidatus Limnocylindrales bacterium]|nr:GNAT family N-acetyltransferase [Candidatus Limnocylindrales bacterium]